MVLQTSDDAEAFRRLNRQISRSLRRDIRNFNTNCIKEAIERNKGSKVFARDVSVGQSQLTKRKTVDGNIASTKAEVLREIENFYEQLYTSIAIPVSSSAVDPRAKLTRHFTEDIPDISLYEIRMALKQLKNNKAPGEDEITSELLQAVGTPVLKLLEWDGLGININGEYITHLRFADDIVVMAESLEDLGAMLEDFNRVSQQVGLWMNIDKTKVMSNAHVAPTPVSVGSSILEKVDKYVYLGL
ncbi:hypothetical protein ABMA27_005128 [Loxostege sticticalis]|uniref:Reverse transcriptase domain-containing protein n=1 Tax=Loxostege sticticalis TaxID=481309 RepID=A0ABR3HLX7_LOXSC